MNIKPGKWRMRNGECAVVEFRTARAIGFPWHGFLADSELSMTWADGGTHTVLSESEFDLIEPWTDKPVVNWSAMPAWAKWVAQDHDGTWTWYAEMPLAKGMWFCAISGPRGVIPKAFAPSFTGNWRDSLVERPAK